MLTIGIEGHVCAGKTTFIQNFEKHFNCLSIKEYWHFRKEFVIPRISFPCSCDDLFQSSKVFCDIENARYATFNCAKDTNITIIDRTYHSCLAFDYAISRLFGLSGYLKIKQYWESHNFIIPNIIFFLDVSHRERIRRHKQRKSKAMNILLDRNFNALYKKYFQENISCQNKIFFIQNNVPFDEHLEFINALLTKNT